MKLCIVVVTLLLGIQKNSDAHVTVRVTECALGR